MKKLVLVYGAFHPRAEAQETVFDDDLLNPEPEVAEALRQSGWNVEMVCVDGSIRRALAPYDPREWVVFNLIEEWCGWSIGSARAPSIYEALGFSYTGSDAPAIKLTTRKDKMKERLVARGIPTPRYRVFKHGAAEWPYRFPAIVKPVAECGSLGVDNTSVVLDQAALYRQVEIVTQRYRQPALVEEFVEGRELFIGVWGNQPTQVLPLSEIDYALIGQPLDRIYSFPAKWIRTSLEYKDIPIHCPANVEPELARALTELGANAYRALGLRDYCRMDVRVGADGPMLIDVNANPALYPNNEFPAQAEVAGYDYVKMLDQIAGWAHERMENH